MGADVWPLTVNPVCNTPCRLHLLSHGTVSLLLNKPKAHQTKLNADVFNGNPPCPVSLCNEGAAANTKTRTVRIRERKGEEQEQEGKGLVSFFWIWKREQRREGR